MFQTAVNKAVCAAARKRRQSMYLGNGRQASATVPGPGERHRCFGPFEQATQCKRDDHATNQALCPGALIVGSVVTSVLVPTSPLAGSHEVELFSFVRKKRHGLQGPKPSESRHLARARKENSPPPVSYPSQRVRLARPFKPGVVNLL